MTPAWEDHSIFTIDHAKMLADAILSINRSYLEELERMAQVEHVDRGSVSMRMMEIQCHWRDDIQQTCENMLKHMSDTVNSVMKQCADLLAVYPRPTLIDVREKPYG